MAGALVAALVYRPLRDRLMSHWYRGKMLGRVGGRDFLWRDEDFRRELFDALAATIDLRPEDAALPRSSP